MYRTAIFRLLFSILLLTLVVGCGGGGGGDSPGAPPTDPNAEIAFEGEMPSPVEVAYFDENGRPTATTAVPGLVYVLMDTDESTAVRRAIVENASGPTAQVVLQMPEAGLYWASVPIGDESSYIAAVRQATAVVWVGPLVVAATDELYPSSGVIDAVAATPSAVATGVVVVDSFVASSPGTSHGDAVSSLASSCGAAVTRYNAGLAPDEVRMDYVIRVLEHVVSGSPTFINFSFGGTTPIPGGTDRSNCTTTECAGERRAVLEDLARKLGYLEVKLRTQPARYGGLVIVQALGNKGVDLTAELQSMTQRFPAAMSHFMFVGSQTEQGSIDRAMNHVGVSIPNVTYAPRLPSVGTSYSAPQAACLLERLAASRPDLTAVQLVDVFGSASSNNVGKLPSLGALITEAQSRYPLASSSLGTFVGTYRWRPPAGPSDVDLPISLALSESGGVVSGTLTIPNGTVGVTGWRSGSAISLSDGGNIAVNCTVSGNGSVLSGTLVFLDNGVGGSSVADFTATRP